MTSQMAQLDLFEVLSSVSILLNALRIDAYLATVNSIDTFIEVSLDCTYLNSLHLKRAVRVPVFQPFKYEIHKSIRSTWTGQPGFGFGPDNCNTLQ